MFKPEVRKSHDELFEVDFSVPVVVKYVDNSPALQLDLYTTMSKSQPKHWVDFKLKGHLTSGFCCNSGNDMNSSVDSEPDPSRSLKHVYSYFYTYVHTFTHMFILLHICSYFYTLPFHRQRMYASSKEWQLPFVLRT